MNSRQTVEALIKKMRESYGAVSEDDVTAQRAAIAEKLTGGATIAALDDSLMRLAKMEGTSSHLLTAERVMTYHVPGVWSETTLADWKREVREWSFERLVQGPDDQSSGRTNEFRRAAYDGIRDAARLIESRIDQFNPLAV